MNGVLSAENNHPIARLNVGFTHGNHALVVTNHATNGGVLG